MVAQRQQAHDVHRRQRAHHGQHRRDRQRHAQAAMDEEDGRELARCGEPPELHQLPQVVGRRALVARGIAAWECEWF